MVVPHTLHLEPGERHAVRVTFKPYQEGEEKGTITFYSNDPVEPVTRVALSGGSSESDTQWTKTQEGDRPEYKVEEVDSGCAVLTVSDSAGDAFTLLFLLLIPALYVLKRRKQ